MSDEKNTGTSEDERETNDLLALLYPDDGVEIEKSERVSDDDVAAIQSLRSLFRDLPEEEPSDAVTNKLLAMAAQHAAKAPAESKGFFGRLSDWLMPLMAHPGLAAAATLVLVVGVAGTLYVKGGAEMAEPQVASRSMAPEASDLAPKEVAGAAEIASPDTNDMTIADEQEAPSDDPAAAAPANAYGRSAEDQGALGGLLDTDTRGSEAANKQDLTKNAAADKGSKLAVPAKKSKSKDAVLDNLNAELGGSVGSAGSGGGGAQTGAADRGGSGIRRPEPDPVPVSKEEGRAQQTKLPAPKKSKPVTKPSSSTRSPSSPPPPPRASADSAEYDDVDRESAGEEQQEKAPAKTTAATLHSQAVQAANRGDCTRVLSLGDQIRKLDSAYYDRTFLSDARLKPCRSAKK